MAVDRVHKVVSFALYSRILIIFLQLFFNYLMPDHNADAFKPPSVHKRGVLEKVVFSICSGLNRWDGQHFIHIAENGYTYEHNLAFFPGFPLILKTIANTVFYPLQIWIHESTLILLAAVTFNFILFVYTSKTLYRLGIKVLGDESLAYRAAQLFCINPASIFFSAAYSETLFAFLTFSGMLRLETGQNFRAAVIFGLSGCVRSNGLVNCGFILYKKFKGFVESLSAIRRTKFVSYQAFILTVFSLIWIITIPAVIQLALSALPFVLYQYYAYTLFCFPEEHSYQELSPHLLNYGKENDYKMAYTNASVWCNSTLPSSYAYIQSAYWNVGMFSYFVTKQIPNIGLAAPMTLLATCASLYYVTKNFKYCISLGCCSSKLAYKKDDDLDNNSQMSSETSTQEGYQSTKVYVYIVHMTFLLAVGVCMMHIQVITRFLACSSPVIYWFVASITTDTEEPEEAEQEEYTIFAENKNGTTPDSSENEAKDYDIPEEPSPKDDILDWDNKSWINRAIFIYFHMYFFVGTAAFANFLPWT